MPHHSIKQLKLVTALLVAFGLGFTRILPVQASAIAGVTDSSKLEKTYQFHLEDSTLATPQSAKNKPPASVVQAGAGSAISNDPTKTNSSAAKTSQAKQSQKEPGDTADNRFFPFALIAIIAVIIYNLLNRGGRTPAAQPTPPTAPSTQTTSGANDPVTLPPSQVNDKDAAEPVAVPTPALLPGLLGLGLKLMRQKKVGAQTASGLEAS
ncbi:hypothetical protein C8255_12330 [filamentous cyanobacterium CCP3]|nr:hypothetical protein C8255_12330 [filamentous cyanobacterium CCP3]